MNKIKNNNFYIPLDVPSNKKSTYKKNYLSATKESGNLFLFAGDQKIEHLNQDFFGLNIPPECNSPEYLFLIAEKGNVGVFATQLGLISKYGEDYKDLNYIVKLNSKTNIVDTELSDPISLFLNTPQEAVEFQKNSKLKIAGLGYTIYLGSKYEAQMLRQAAQTVFEAHKNGMLAVLWIYPRGKAVTNEKDIKFIEGAAGVGACLGADFIKVNPPQAESVEESARILKIATEAAGRSKVICAGGKRKYEKEFLEELYLQLSIGKTSGCAIGRNVYQKDPKYSASFCKAINSLVVESSSLKKALKFLK